MPYLQTLVDSTPFNLDGKDINFTKFVTDNLNQDAYYEIFFNYALQDTGPYLFSFFHYNPVTGPQFSNDFAFVVELSDSSQSYLILNASRTIEGLPSYEILDSDQDGLQYPTNVRKISLLFDLSFSNPSKIVIRFSKPWIFIDEKPYFNPGTVSKELFLYGFQLEKALDNGAGGVSITPSIYSPYELKLIDSNISPAITTTLPSRFQYFVYRLNGIQGEFVKVNLNTVVFKANDEILKNQRRLNCSEYDCWQSRIESNPAYSLVDKDTIYKYKNVNYENSDLFKFFKEKIDPFLSNILENDFAKLYTDFDKLYFVGQQYNFNDGKVGTLQKITYVKTDPVYGNAIKEIIDLLTKYKSFDYTLTNQSQFQYRVPLSYPGDSYTVIPNEDLDNIVFAGFLNQSLDLNIQAGFCRYYLNPQTPKTKISGYFYETNNFFDVRNDNVVKVQNNTVSYVNIFPSDKPLINQRPYLNIVDIKSLNFSRLIKNDLSVDFTKTLNYIGYVGDCYYRELKTGVEVQLTGLYTTNRKMSDVWKIEILDTLESIPSYSSPEDTPISQKTYEAKDFGDKKTGFSESKYLKIIHKNMEVSNAFLEDRASITLTSSLGTEEYKSYKTLL